MEIVGHAVPSRYNSIEFLVESTLSIEYDEDKKPAPRRWKAN